ncbi:MAG TPA: carbohydrate ABC transporter permease [Ktedonobacteraceae bacterium]
MSLFPKVGRKQGNVRVIWWAVVVVLCIGVILHLLPFYFMILTSFKSGLEVFQYPPTLWPQQPTLAAWQLIWQVASSGLTSPTTPLMPDPFYLYLFNSLIQVGGVLLISLPITAFAAYANSKLQRGPMARWSFIFFIGTLMVPASITLLPTLLLSLNFPFALPSGSVPNVPGTDQIFPTISIWDTALAIILPAGFNAFNFLIFKGFFDTIPNSVIQAARVDGGSEFNIFRRIVFPMSIPVFAVALWLQFSGVWDNFLWPSLAFRTTANEPTSVAIYTLITNFDKANVTNAAGALGQSAIMKQALASGLTWNGLMVLGLIQTIPIFLVFILCREYLLRGVRIRGLK